jgi:hypothetical protein
MTFDLGKWGVLYDALLKAGLKLPTSSNSQFQMITSPMVAAWNDLNQLYYADLYGNYPSAEMGPTYSRSAGSVSDGYYDFINSLEYPDPSKDLQYQKLISQQKTLTTNLGLANQTAVGAYKAWLEDSSDTTTFPAIKSISDWLASGLAGGAQYNAQIDDINTQLNNVNQQLIPFLSGSGLAIKNAVAAVALDNQKTTAIPGSKDTKKVYSQSISPQLGSLLLQWQSGQKSNSVSIALNNTSKDTGSWYVEAGAGFDFSYGIIGIFGEGGITYNKTIENDSSFSCTLDVQATALFDIVRNNWFNGGLLTEYLNGPWSSKTAEQFFGSKGSLKLVPTQILVAYGVSFTITATSKTFNEIQKSWKAHGGLAIGPFIIGGEGAGHSNVTTNSDDTQTLTFDSTDNNPYVIGFLSQSFYQEEPLAQSKSTRLYSSMRGHRLPHHTSIQPQPISFENNSGRYLGVNRDDVDIDCRGYVVLNGKGMSVAPHTAYNLPSHMMPPTFGGSGQDPVWFINQNNLDPMLVYIPDQGLQPTHGVIAPKFPMSLAEYQQALANTADRWQFAFPSNQALLIAKEATDVKTHIFQALQSGHTFDQWCTLIIGFHKQGYSQEQIYRVLEEARSHAQTEDQEDFLLEIMDVVYGFCSPDQRIWPESLKL